MNVEQFREEYQATIAAYPDVTGIMNFDDENEFIIETVANFVKVGRTWKKVAEKTSKINFVFYCNVIAPETIRFFRNLGGIETVKRNYTKAGYLPTEIISTSPDRQSQTRRSYKFF